ncbi:hypothetical protein [Aquamicrobium soli]|uniref:Transposase n=1 Tax=Aquamicrobium soli TaxID=1811518 RepID=A0ABV7KK75_9HYPH
MAVIARFPGQSAAVAANKKRTNLDKYAKSMTWHLLPDENKKST